MSARETLKVRAVRAEQGQGVGVFAFFLYGADIHRIADISRIRREDQELKGFQRREIRDHVKEITAFLDSGPVLFPNAIILALSPEIDFASARGRSPGNMCEVGDAGTLSIPIYPEGRRAAWIVDGQQRSLALAAAKDPSIAVPVIGFISDALDIQREQFILVNKARPLPTRLINELLPEVSVLLPRDLAARKLPSALCEALNTDPHSPFHGLIKRESDRSGIVTDNALIETMKASLRTPAGALGQFKGNGTGSDTEAMYETLLLYWGAVKDVFPDAWGIPPSQSRLMHSAGIRAMGALMDTLILRVDAAADKRAAIRAILGRLAPHCRWTEGSWDGLGLEWNDVQSTSQHISRLSDHLMHLERELARVAP
ncbi:DGQHR domain-containing protein DpdB [Sphingopyxis granuli]|uniref:DGQHR domain-containing protein DpdB n=1 Tax=Sphingopyxis granuli TaxID=267128 RepID=UPI00083582EB|nr:DGQHR domain-containing protein DpdB [Sphingopyxis granuli]